MYERCFKRIIDIMLSVLGLPVFGLIYIVVAPMIILDDGLPVFYNALRIGKNGKLFRMYKFRTMKKMLLIFDWLTVPLIMALMIRVLPEWAGFYAVPV